MEAMCSSETSGLMELHGASPLKMLLFIAVPVRTSNPMKGKFWKTSDVIEGFLPLPYVHKRLHKPEAREIGR
jgi:hypothetical protein